MSRLDDVADEGLLKREVEAVRDVFINGGIEELPPGDTIFRFSNAVSWVAKSAETAERRLDLESAAGQLLLGGAKSRELARVA